MAKSSVVNFKVPIYGVIIFMTSFQTVFLPTNEENVLGGHHRRRTALGSWVLEWVAIAFSLAI